MFPNSTRLTGWYLDRAVSADSTRRSTRPAVSWARAAAVTLIRRSVSRLAPAAFLAARSATSAVWYAAAPWEAITRTVMPADPEPKDARTAGAQARSRLVPNSVRTAAVSTTTSEWRGSGETGPSASRSRRGNPRAASAAHIAWSQDTVTPGLTCWATQPAASARTAASWRAGAALGGPLPRVPVRCRTATTDSDPMTRAGITIRAASPAPSQVGDSGSASGSGPPAPGVPADGGLPAVPSHSVTSSSVTGPALAARTG